MNIRNEILLIFEENGVDINDDSSWDEIDSIQYISIIVEIEQTFDITLSDNLMVRSNFLTINDFINAVVETYDEAIK